MVVGQLSSQKMELSTLRTASKLSTASTLKFGIDRILASDSINPSRLDNYGLASDAGSCVMLRCRSPCNPRFFPMSIRVHQPSYMPHTVCVPQPLRPYSNVVIQGEGSHRDHCSPSASQQKRKRSWSRAVFSNLQRKGLEKRFQLQKYITKPDRRQLAATLGLTDAQVKVWFQNRRMKWRHAKEGSTEESKCLIPNCAPNSLPDKKIRRQKAPHQISQYTASDSESEVDIQTVEIG